MVKNHNKYTNIKSIQPLLHYIPEFFRIKIKTNDSKNIAQSIVGKCFVIKYKIYTKYIFVKETYSNGMFVNLESFHGKYNKNHIDSSRRDMFGGHCHTSKLDCWGTDINTFLDMIKSAKKISKIRFILTRLIMLLKNVPEIFKL